MKEEEDGASYRPLFSGSAPDLLINLNVLEGTLFPALSPEDRRAEIAKGMMTSQLGQATISVHGGGGKGGGGEEKIKLKFVHHLEGGKFLRDMIFELRGSGFN